MKAPPPCRCEATHKHRYASRFEAEIDADKIALIAWEDGKDALMNAFPCRHCGDWHVGTKRWRPRKEGRAPMHEYRRLPAPGQRVEPIRAGNVK